MQTFSSFFLSSSILLIFASFSYGGEATLPNLSSPFINPIQDEAELSDSIDASPQDVLDNGLISPKPIEKPKKAVDTISSKANEWHEPSQESEEIYIQAIRQWLSSLPPQKRIITRKILKDAHPVMHSLRMAIREKKAQLSSLSFDSNTLPETLPRLGLELQKLKHTLKLELAKLGNRLKNEADVQMGPLGGDGFWLAPPANKANKSTFHPFSSIQCTNKRASLSL